MSVSKSVASRNNREIIVHEYHPYVRNATHLQTLHSNMTVGGMNSGGGNLSCSCEDDMIIWEGCGCVPEWWLICYYAVIGAAFFCNLFVCGMLLKRKKDGILASILQLALVDTATASIAIVEVLDTNHRTWTFTPEICPLFVGTETLLSSLSLYLIVFFNFHVISTYNLHLYQLQNGNNHPLTSCDDGDSEEFLVSTSRNSLDTNRTLALDYSKRKHYVSILLPSLLVWVLCISISVPEYSLAQTMRVSDKYTVCTVMVETHYKQTLRYLLVLFKILVPVLLMLISFLILLIKLYTYNCGKSITKRFIIKKTYTVNFLLSFAIGLSLLYLVTSFHRWAIHFVNVKQQVFSVDTLEMLKISKLENFFDSHLLNVLLSMFYYSATALRSVLYICMLPELRENFIAAVLPRTNKSN